MDDKEFQKMLSNDSLHTRVAVLEVTVAMMKAEFSDLRRSIVNVGIMVVAAIVSTLVASNIYFLKQKDELLAKIDEVLQLENQTRSSVERLYGREER